MQAGKLRNTIHIERVAETVTATGEVLKTWTCAHVVSAEIVQRSAVEFLAGFGEAQNANVIFRIRYRRGITTADRIRHEGTAYAIKEITEIGRRNGLEIRATAIE